MVGLARSPAPAFVGSAKARNGGFGPRQYLAANWSGYLLG